MNTIKELQYKKAKDFFKGFLLCALYSRGVQFFIFFDIYPSFFLQSIKEEWFKSSHYWKLEKWES